MIDSEQQQAADEESPSPVPLSLYDEARDSMQNAFLMFCMPVIRDMASNGELTGDHDTIQRLIDLPCSAWDGYSIFVENFQAISEKIGNQELAEMYEATIAGRTNSVDELFNDNQDGMEHVQLLAFDDANCEEELVYAVGVNHPQKRVNVAFRGSVTHKDFVMDAKIFVASMPNPIQDLESELGVSHSKVLGVHLGFREDLFGEEGASIFAPNVPKKRSEPLTKRRKDNEVDAPGKKRKVDEIMDTISKLLEEHPGYRLYVAGHSLGGALACLFAFTAAAASDDTIPKPVTCITTGAPKVGNLDFLLAFEALEERNKIRCLRITNDRDVVTLSPPIGAYGCCHAVCCQRRRFRHVGVRLKLSPRGYIFSYPPKVRSYVGICIFDTIKIVRHWILFIVALVLGFSHRIGIKCRGSLRSEHTQLEYMKRFDRHKETFMEMTLDQLYEMRGRRARWRIPMMRGKVAGMSLDA